MTPEDIFPYSHLKEVNMEQRKITLLRNFWLCAVTVSIMALGSAGWAAEAVLMRGPIATVKSGPKGLSWEPHVEYKRLVLTVKVPGGKVIRKEFDPGSMPVFGGPFADGQYTYELSVIPVVSPEVRQVMEKARATGDMSVVKQLRREGKLPKGPQAQSGYFRVGKGKVLLPGAVEPRYRGKKKKKDQPKK